jgi:hypothetical protein
MENTMVTPQNLDKISALTTNMFISLLSKNSPGFKILIDERRSLKEELFEIFKDFFARYINKRLPQAGQSPSFVKVAGGPRRFPGGGGGGGKGGGKGGGLMGADGSGKPLEKILGGNPQDIIEIAFDLFSGPGGWLRVALKLGAKFLAPRIQKAFEQSFLNLDLKRREYILNTMQSFQEKMKPHEFSPSAFKKVLDQKGYKGQEHSQGAYDIKTPAFNKEIKDEKAKNPGKFKAPYSYLEDKDVQERKKGNKFKFYNPAKKEEQSSEEEDTIQASISQKFIKVSQAQNVDQELNRRIEAIKKLLSPWNEEMIKQSFLKISNRTDISEEQKSAIIEKQVDEYMRSIKPLQSYMDSLRKI